jgi:hypothetical protein
MCLLWLSSIVSSRGLKKEFFRVVTHQQYIGCLIKTQVRNSSQTIFQAGSPWATLILNSLLCPAVAWGDTFSNIPFTLSFAKTSFFYFLSSIFLEFWENPFPKIYDALLQPNKKKTAPKQFFKGVAHEQHWSSIVCLWWWPSILSSCCPRLKFSNIPFSFFLCHFFSFT